MVYGSFGKFRSAAKQDLSTFLGLRFGEKDQNWKSHFLSASVCLYDAYIASSLYGSLREYHLLLSLSSYTGDKERRTRIAFNVQMIYSRSYADVSLISRIS